MLLGKKPDMALAQVPAYRQLSKRYESRKCFVFGNAQGGFRLLRQGLDTDELDELNTVDNVLGLRDIMAVGIGSSIGIKPNEAAMEMTILLDESNPMRSLSRGAPIDPTQNLKVLPKGCFFGLFANFTDTAATWQQIGKLFGEFGAARDFQRFRERSIRDGIDIDELGKMASGPIGLFMVPPDDDPDDASGALAISIRDHNSLKTSLQKAIDADPRQEMEEIGKFEGRPVDGGDFESFMIGPGYAFLGLDMGGGAIEATRKGIAAAEDEANRGTALIRTIASIGDGTATKVFFLAPSAFPGDRTMRKLAPAEGVDFPWVLTCHEEKDALRFRSNVSVFTIIMAMILVD